MNLLTKWGVTESRTEAAVPESKSKFKAWGHAFWLCLRPVIHMRNLKAENARPGIFLYSELVFQFPAHVCMLRHRCHFKIQSERFILLPRERMLLRLSSITLLDLGMFKYIFFNFSTKKKISSNSLTTKENLITINNWMLKLKIPVFKSCIITDSF